MANNINQSLQTIIQLANTGRTPQQVMQMLMQRNPNANVMMNQIKNMANGRSLPEFIMDYAKQKGVDQNLLTQVGQLMGVKK